MWEPFFIFLLLYNRIRECSVFSPWGGGFAGRGYRNLRKIRSRKLYLPHFTCSEWNHITQHAHGCDNLEVLISNWCYCLLRDWVWNWHWQSVYSNVNTRVCMPLRETERASSCVWRHAHAVLCVTSRTCSELRVTSSRMRARKYTVLSPHVLHW